MTNDIDDIACVGMFILIVAGFAFDSTLQRERLERDQRARKQAEYKRHKINTLETYYDILGVSRYAGFTEIKEAYRTLALKYHPDICHENNAVDRFTMINKAYQVLSDNKLRSQYDLTVPVYY
jgi:DnaJ-domain-containing protein 1